MNTNMLQIAYTTYKQNIKARWTEFGLYELDGAYLGFIKKFAHGSKWFAKCNANGNVKYDLPDEKSAKKWVKSQIRKYIKDLTWSLNK